MPIFNHFGFLAKADGSKTDIITPTTAEDAIKSKNDNKNKSSNTTERYLDIVREPVNFADRSNLKISNLRKTLTRKNTLEEKLKKMEKIKERAKNREREISDQYFNNKKNNKDLPADRNTKVISNVSLSESTNRLSSNYKLEKENESNMTGINKAVDITAMDQE
ncbi:hypothetical protein AYI69_g10854 [Smittium culicis]|uniref:Uncharacterized protein n=1 Tax=Smittium culicis TaxID=133412 RepID=A0A1R1X310_9FUNG|nr:hypothetical protein AYI69_g10854 [Smittium culicis]